MTEIEFAIVVLLAVAGGWAIGIVGFFQAIMARREIAQLRRALADLRPVAPPPKAQPAPGNAQAKGPRRD